MTAEKLKLAELITPEFRTSESAYKKNKKLEEYLGTNRYPPARLALALSLAEKTPVKMNISDTKGDSIRGRQLFGESGDMAAWVALITQHAGRDLSKEEFSIAVAAHWERGINILSKIWEGADKDFDKFISALSERSGVLDEVSESYHQLPTPTQQVAEPTKSTGAIDLHIGKFLGGDTQGEDAGWQINASGHPPHIAIMGASGGGKTRLALRFIEEVTSQTDCAVFIFDMKGDIAKNSDNSVLLSKINANTISCPEISVPLDILHVADPGNNTIVQNIAARLCDSLDCAIQGGIGAVQKDRLRRVAAQMIARKNKVSMSELREALIEHYRDENIKDDSIIAALNRLVDYNLFSPEHAPSDFFRRSWVFVMNDAAAEMQRFAALMILDALNRYFAGLPEAHVDRDENRQIRAFLSIDEAHKILGFRHPAVNDILRLSRSKGGAVMLISQSPNDYMREDTNLLENIGLTICFETNATTSSLRKVFSEGVKVDRLGKGNCVVRFSGQGKSVQKVKIWS